MPQLPDTIALVTGASRGMGRGIAEELGAAGATVYVTGRSREQGRQTEGLPGSIEETAQAVTAAGGLGIAVACDHTVDEDTEELFWQIRTEQGRLDLLVNNVWGGYERYDHAAFTSPFWEQPLEFWDGMFTAGVRAHVTASRFAAPLMIEAGGGLIINISAGDRRKYLGNLMYDMAKAAVNRMSFGMSVELRQHGIAAVCLQPGFTRTERVLAAYEGDLSVTESPRYTGRAVVALAADETVLERSGMVYRTGELAQIYGFVDVDGRQVPPFDIGERFPRPEW